MELTEALPEWAVLATLFAICGGAVAASVGLVVQRLLLDAKPAPWCLAGALLGVIGAVWGRDLDPTWFGPPALIVALTYFGAIPCPKPFRRNDGWDWVRVVAAPTLVVVLPTAAGVALAVVLAMVALVLVLVVALVALVASPLIAIGWLPGGAYHLAGIAVGLWVAGVYLLRSPPAQTRGTRQVAWRNALRSRRPLWTLVLTAGTGMTVGHQLWRADIEVERQWAPLAGFLVAAGGVLVARASRALWARRRRAATPPAAPAVLVREGMSRALLGAGLLGFAAGAVVLEGLARWAGAAALVVGAITILGTPVTTRTTAVAPLPNWRRWAALAVLLLELVMATVDTTAFHLAVPDLQRDLGMGLGAAAWVINAYVLAYACTLALGGALANKVGWRRTAQIGFLMLGVASLIGWGSDETWELLAARALMGVGAGLAAPISMPYISALFPDREETRRARNAAFNAFTIVYGAGLAVGPIVGGLLLSGWGWPAVFAINAPVVALAVVGAAFLLPEVHGPNEKLDLFGLVLSVGAFLPLLYAVMQGPTEGWSSVHVVIPIPAGLCLLAALVWWELGRSQPLLPLRLLSKGSYAAPSAIGWLSMFTVLGAGVLVSVHLQQVLGLSEVEAGVRMLPLAAGIFAAAIAATWLERLLRDARLVLTVGLLTLAGGALGFAWAVSRGYGELIVALALSGLGFGLLVKLVAKLVVGSLKTEEAAPGSALDNVARQLFGAFGVAAWVSAMVAAYSSEMRERLGALTDPRAAHAADGLEQARDTAEAIGGPQGALVIKAAHDSFIQAERAAALWVGLGAVGLALAVVAAWAIASRLRGSTAAGRTEAAAATEK